MALGLAVHPPLVVVPGRLEELDQVARGDDLGAERADQLDGAGVDLGDVRVGVPRRVFHRHAASSPRPAPATPGFELLPAEVDRLLARQVVEHARLDPVDELARRPLGGDRVVEPPRRRSACRRGRAPGGPARCCRGSRQSSQPSRPNSRRADWTASRSNMEESRARLEGVRRLPRSVRPPDLAHDRPLHLERVDRADLAVDDLAAGGDQERVGDRAGPFLVEGLGELVAVVGVAGCSSSPRRGSP